MIGCETRLHRARRGQPVIGSRRTLAVALIAAVIGAVVAASAIAVVNGADENPCAAAHCRRR